MWWNSCSSSPLILLWYPSCSRWRWEGGSHGRLSLPVQWLASRPLADAAVRRSCWSAWQESLLCNAACHKGLLRGAWPHTEPFRRCCLWWAERLSCGNSALSFAGFNSWNSMDLHASGRKTLRASGCYVEEQVFFFLSFWVFVILGCFVVFKVISSMPFRTQQVYFSSILLLTPTKFLKEREIKIYRW